MVSRKKYSEYTDSYHEHLIESLKDPDEAFEYLQIALEEYDIDGNSEIFMIALRNLAEARGGINHLAKATHLNRQNLYRILSKSGNPRLNTLATIIHSLGFRLSITKLNKAA